MVRDSRSGIREYVETELAKLDTLESRYVFPFHSLFWSYREFTSSFPALVRVGEEHGRPSTHGRDDVSGAQRIAYGARAARILPYTAVRPARGVVDIVGRCCLDLTHPPAQ